MKKIADAFFIVGFIFSFIGALFLIMAVEMLKFYR